MKNDTKNSRQTQTSRLKSFALAGVVGLTMAFSGQPVLAGNDVAAEIAHTIRCAGLLITDPAQHLIECGINDYKPGPLYEEYPTPPQEPNPDIEYGA